MTVRGKSTSDSSIQRSGEKDILFKLLWRKPSGKSRREVVHSAGSSFPCHISRKLLLEEHKLSMRLDQIEKERKQFLNKNSSEKHMLQLSARTAQALDKRRNSGQYLLMSDKRKCHSSAWEHWSLKKGNSPF